jgi:hypothetical protein
MAFKMKGHTLPGIKQRPSAKAADGRAKSSALQAASMSDFKDMGETMQKAAPKEESSNLETAGQMLGGALPMKQKEEKKTSSTKPPKIRRNPKTRKQEMHTGSKTNPVTGEKTETYSAY